MKKAIIYSTQSCIYCHALMDWMDAEGIEYEGRDVDRPEVAAEARERLGFEVETVPTTVIGDEVIVGFDRPGVKRALAKLGN